MSVFDRFNLGRLLEQRKYESLAHGARRLEFSQDSLRGEGYSSQCGQDKFVVETLFPGLTGGVFVDVGAHDGVSFSNTHYLERIGWSGLAVEPMPDVYERLVSNRNCATINCCIAAEEGSARFRRVSGYSEMLSGLVDTYDPRHLARLNRELGAHGGSVEEFDVQCHRLNALLGRYGLQRVHYLNIDVEGAEHEILKSVDFSAAEILACGIENNYRDPRIPALMKRNGYRMIAVVGDEFYVREGTPGL